MANIGTITILIPVYGVEQYMEECAVSLFEQTYKDIEYIFCDDCTPDRSIEILKEVTERYPERKPHVRIIRNKHNLGIGGTRARLLSEVKSDYFLFADSDDFLPLNATEVLANRMTETDVDIVEGAFQLFTENKYGAITYPCHDDIDKYRKKIRIRTICHTLLGRLYKSEILTRVPDLFVQGIDVAEDYCALSRLVSVTSRAWTDEVVFYYRTDNAGSYTKQVTRKEVISYLNAIGLMVLFYASRGSLPLSVEIGALNAYRSGYEVGMSASECDEIIQYQPEHLFAKTLYRLFHSNNLAYHIADITYRIMRKAISKL